MNLPDLLKQYGVKYLEAGEHHHTTLGFIQLDCPFCSPDTSRWRMGYSLRDKYFTCWQCGYHSVVSTLTELFRIDSGEAKRLASGLRPSAGRLDSERKSGRLKLPDGHTGGLDPCHISYLRNRGYDHVELMRLWNISGLGVTSFIYAWRIYIPIKLKGKTVSWTTRSISDHVSKRYLNAPSDHEAFPAKQTLYGLDYVRHVTIVCEGPTDVWRIGPGSVATMGLKVTTSQIKLLANIPHRVICFDQGNEAQSRARELADRLSLFPGRTEVVELDAADPGSATDKEVSRLRSMYLEG